MDIDLTAIDWVSALIAFGLAILGAAFHHAKKYARGEYKHNLLIYWFKDKPYASAQALLSMLVTVIVLVNNEDVSVTNLGGILMLLSVGYSLDSAVNRFDTEKTPAFDATLGKKDFKEGSGG